jgi:TPR repeat protein
LAANQGHAQAQYNLGVMHANGEGVQQDFTKAVKWYRLAADQGDAKAQFNLGAMHANGEVCRVLFQNRQFCRQPSRLQQSSKAVQAGTEQTKGMQKHNSTSVRCTPMV